MDCRMAARSARYMQPPRAILCGGGTTMHMPAARLLLLAALLVPLSTPTALAAADAPVVVSNDFASPAALTTVDYDHDLVTLTIGPRAVTERQQVLRYQAKG